MGIISYHGTSKKSKSPKLYKNLDSLGFCASNCEIISVVSMGVHEVEMWLNACSHSIEKCICNIFYQVLAALWGPFPPERIR